MRYPVNSRGVSSIRVSYKAFGDASIEIRMEDTPRFFLPRARRCPFMVGGRKKRKVVMGTRRYQYFERHFKSSVASLCNYDGDMPILASCHVVPKCLVSFNKRFRPVWKGAFVHSFSDDYAFDGPSGIWWDTERHREILSSFGGVLSPDFSVYADAGRIPQLWNVYRSRLVGWQFQSWGLNVIPTVSWGMEDTFDFCFNGLPSQSVLAVSTVGVMRDAKARRLFEIGFREMCKRKTPELVVIYGTSRGLDLGDQVVRCYDNNTYDWTRLTTQTESEE